MSVAALESGPIVLGLHIRRRRAANRHGGLKCAYGLLAFYVFTSGCFHVSLYLGGTVPKGRWRLMHLHYSGAPSTIRTMHVPQAYPSSQAALPICMTLVDTGSGAGSPSRSANGLFAPLSCTPQAATACRISP